VVPPPIISGGYALLWANGVRYRCQLDCCKTKGAQCASGTRTIGIGYAITGMHVRAGDGLLGAGYR